MPEMLSRLGSIHEEREALLTFQVNDLRTGKVRKQGFLAAECWGWLMGESKENATGHRARLSK